MIVLLHSDSNLTTLALFMRDLINSTVVPATIAAEDSTTTTTASTTSTSPATSSVFGDSFERCYWCALSLGGGKEESEGKEEEKEEEGKWGI